MTGPWKTQDAEQLLEAFELARTVLADVRDPVELAGQMYRQWYARPRTAIPEYDPTWPPLPNLLRAAHAGTRTWQSGSRVRKVAMIDSVVVSESDGMRALCRDEYVVPDAPGLLPEAGATVTSIGRRGAVVGDGWWWTWSRGWDRTSPPDEVSRIYLAARLESIAELVHKTTCLLADVAEPWSMKVATAPEVFARADSTVVYVADRSASDVARAIAAECGGLVHAAVPPFSAQVAPGVAIAEDPDTGESFGEVRCRLVAEAVSRCKQRTDTALFRELAKVFAEQGLGVDEPHRRAA